LCCTSRIIRRWPVAFQFSFLFLFFPPLINIFFRRIFDRTDDRIKQAYWAINDLKKLGILNVDMEKMLDDLLHFDPIQWNEVLITMDQGLDVTVSNLH